MLTLSASCTQRKEGTGCLTCTAVLCLRVGMTHQHVQHLLLHEKHLMIAHAIIMLSEVSMNVQAVS